MAESSEEPGAGHSTDGLVEPTLAMGRGLRLLLGLALLLLVVPFYRAAGQGLVLTALGYAVGFLVFYTLVHLAVRASVPRLNRWLGAVLAFAPLVVVFALSGPAGQVGTQTFLGASLVVAAVRADSGCEVMSLPGIVLGRRTHLVCLLFSPLDWMESKVTGRRRG